MSTKEINDNVLKHYWSVYKNNIGAQTQSKNTNENLANSCNLYREQIDNYIVKFNRYGIYVSKNSIDTDRIRTKFNILIHENIAISVWDECYIIPAGYMKLFNNMLNKREDTCNII